MGRSALHPRDDPALRGGRPGGGANRLLDPELAFLRLADADRAALALLRIATP